MKKPKETTDIVVQESKEVASVESFISQAIASNVPIETLERLMVLRKDVRAEQAKEAFDTAMAKAQGEFPIITKKKNGGQTQSGQVAYKYAPIETIVEQTRDIIEQNGFSYLFKTETSADKVKVMCIAKHKLGHSEFSEMELPLGTKTNVMSAPQVVVATITFAKRYTFCDVFGITTGGEDTEKMPKESEAKKADAIKSEIIGILTKLGLKKDDDVKAAIKSYTGLEASNKIEDMVEIRDRLQVTLEERQ